MTHAGTVAEPKNRSRYFTALEEGRKPVGVYCCLDGYTITHIFAAAGFDYLILDRQHAANDWFDLEQTCWRIRSTGCSVFIRVGSTEEAEINLALDLPIDGIVLPNLVSLEDTKRALRFTRFPPKGVRSLGNERNDVIWAAYSQPEPLIGMLVEHPGAVAEIEAILATGEISFTWIGVHDLSALLNLNPHEIIQPDGKMHPELQAASDKVKAASRKAGVPFWGTLDDSDAYLAGVDARMIRKLADDTLRAQRAR